MTRLMGWLMLTLWATAVFAVAAAPNPAAAPTPAAAMNDLERNAALGEALAQRHGAAEEYAVVQKLYDRGLNAARTLAAATPKSAEIQYLLGSWLLYGYRVVEVENVFYDVNGEERRETEKAVLQGLAEDDAEGLKALEAAHSLAPQNARYFVDYGAALYDCDQLGPAMDVLNKAWRASAKFPLQEKTRTALLLSDILADQGEILEAREWVYRALLLDAKHQDLVPRLRRLDLLQIEALTPPPPPPPVAEPEPPAEEELAPADQGSEDQIAPEEEYAPDDELAPEEGQEEPDYQAPAEGETGE